MKYSGGNDNNYQSSQLARVAEVTVPAKVKFPQIWRKIQILILVGGYGYAFISAYVSSFLISLF